MTTLSGHNCVFGSTKDIRAVAVVDWALRNVNHTAKLGILVSAARGTGGRGWWSTEYFGGFAAALGRQGPMRDGSARLGVAWTYHREYHQGPSRLLTAAPPETLGLRLARRLDDHYVYIATRLLVAMSCPRCTRLAGLDVLDP